MGRTITIDADLSDYEDDIQEYYCNPQRCLGSKMSIDKIRDYVIELDKDLHIYLRPSERTLEQVCYDLMQLIKEG